MAITIFSKFDDVRQAVINILRGEQNNVGEFSLSTGTSTTVQHPNCAPGKTVNITAETASAAAVIASTYIPRATILKGSFTVIHPAGGAGRIFMYEVTGGG